MGVGVLGGVVVCIPFYLLQRVIELRGVECNCFYVYTAKERDI